MQKYILTYDTQTLELTHAPEGWDTVAYTLTRNETYHGVFFGFSGVLRFVKEGKQFIDTILAEHGFEVEINVIIKELDPLTKVWRTKVVGVLNFDPTVYEVDDIMTSVAYISSKVHQKFINQQDTKVSFNRKESLNGTILPGFADEFVDILLRGVEGTESVCTGVYPFELFNRILQVICDLDYNPVVSSLLGRQVHGYVEEGTHSKVMVSKGLLMRGWSPAGDELLPGDVNLSTTFKDLFQSFSTTLHLGLGLDFDATEQRWQFYIESRSYFYQTQVVLTLPKAQISNLKYKYGKEFMYTKVKTGYRKHLEESERALSEYNVETEFSLPITVTEGTFDITSPYRADGVGVQLAIDRRKGVLSTEEDTQESIDEDVFLLDCIDAPAGEDYAIMTRKQEGFTIVDGMYSIDPLYVNVRLAPARNLFRWGEWLNASLAFLQDKKIKFLSTKGLNTLETQLTSETEITYETKDRDISELPATRWSGRIAEFEAPLTRAALDALTVNPLGLVEYWDYISKTWKYGWVKEASTNRLDRETTWILYEAINLDRTSNNLIYVADGETVLLMDGSGAIKTNA